MFRFISKVQGSIRRILNKRHAVLTSTFTNVLDSSGTLQARAFKGSERAASRIARSVAFVIGISLSIPMTVADGGSIDAIQPKAYIKMMMPKHQAKCLITLYSKESAFNPYAIGNLKGKYQTYGIPQLKNALIYDKSPIEQVQWGMRYIKHRYHGDSCLALHHFKTRGWH